MTDQPLLAARLRSFLENFQLDEPIASGNGDAYLTEQTRRLADLFTELQQEREQEIREKLAKLPSPIVGGPAFRMDCLWCCAKWRSDMEHPDNGCLWLLSRLASSSSPAAQEQK